MDKLVNLLFLRLKIMFSHKSFWIIYIIITSLIIILVSELFAQVDKGVRIPVAIVDEDQSEFSEYVIEKLNENELIRLVELSNKDIQESVKKQEVEAVYIINKDAQKKVIKGELKQLIDVYYLDENYFTMMLTDILSGDFLDEICILTASKYYIDGYAKYIGDEKLEIYNDVYLKGHTLTDTNEENYYLNISLVGDNNKDLDFYNQSLVLEKMTIGIIYIFIGFFILFEGLHIIRDRSLDVYKKIKLTSIKVASINLAEILSLMVSGMLISLPLAFVSLYFKRDVVAIISINMLYVISMSFIIFLFLHIIKGIKGYILLGTSVIIGMGIVSGSFFSINLESNVIRFIAKLFPTYYSVNGYFDKAIKGEYSIYTSICVLTIFAICLVIDRKSTKE